MMGMGGTQAAGAVIGSIGDIVSIFGKQQARRDYPMYQPVDLSKETAKSIGMNQANLPAAQQLASQTNVFNQEQVNKMLRAQIPEYDRLNKEILGVIEPGLAGELPKGVLDQLQNQAAAYGVSSGTVGSQFAGYRGLRQLGLNALQYAQQSVNSAEQWMRQAYTMTKAPMMDVTSMFVSPMQGAMFDAQQQALSYESQLGKWSLGNSMLDWGQAISNFGGRLAGAGGTSQIGIGSGSSGDSGGDSIGGGGSPPSGTYNNMSSWYANAFANPMANYHGASGGGATIGTRF